MNPDGTRLDLPDRGLHPLVDTLHVGSTVVGLSTALSKIKVVLNDGLLGDLGEIFPVWSGLEMRSWLLLVWWFFKSRKEIMNKVDVQSPLISIHSIIDL